jgi:hypothetical protein
MSDEHRRVNSQKLLIITIEPLLPKLGGFLERLKSDAVETLIDTGILPEPWLLTMKVQTKVRFMIDSEEQSPPVCTRFRAY